MFSGDLLELHQIETIFFALLQAKPLSPTDNSNYCQLLSATPRHLIKPLTTSRLFHLSLSIAKMWLEYGKFQV